MLIGAFIDFIVASRCRRREYTIRTMIISTRYRLYNVMRKIEFKFVCRYIFAFILSMAQYIMRIMQLQCIKNV